MSLFHKQSISASQASRSSRRYRESTHLIPTPGVERQRPARYVPIELRPWVVFGLAVLMIMLAVGIEIALAISERNQGYPVPARNIFGFVRTSFLTSFFPTLLIFPLGYLWGVVDRGLRWHQPYVALSLGNARAEKSIMLDYVNKNRFVTLYNASKQREWIILFSMATVFAASFYQPLAGGLLAVAKINKAQPDMVTGSFDLGLTPDVQTLNAFLAAAGFTEAAAFQQLPDPPFVRAGWATAPFHLPENPGLNASMTVNTTGVRTSANCYVPTTVKLDTSNPGSYTISATNADRCSAVATFNPVSADQQYGTVAADPVSCGLPANTNVSFAPVMFWFYTSQPSQQASAVICRPSIDLFNTTATVNLNNGSLSDCVIRNPYTLPNSVSSKMDGKAFNAVQFDLSGMNDFVKARAVAIGSQIPGAIFRFASQPPSSLQEHFAAPDGFLNLTSTIYTQHLSVSAKSVYFIDTNQTLPAVKNSQVSRLIVDILAAHALAALLCTVGLVGIAIHILHIHKRRKLYLTAAPGTVASIVALTSHSGFGELLFPYDDQDTIRAKLDPLRFSLDPRTGAIVADEYAYDEGGYKGEYPGDHHRGGGFDARVSGEDEEKMPLRDLGAEPSRGMGDIEEGASEMGHTRPVSSVPSIVGELPYEHEPLVLESDHTAMPLTPPPPMGSRLEVPKI